MGLLKKIGKGFKKVFKGVGKVFKKVFKGVQKFLSSKLGKGLMIALGVFTMGGALAAGAAAWNTAGQMGANFLGKFVAASKGFIGQLTGGMVGGQPAGPGVGADLAAQGASDAVGAVQGAAGAAGDIAAAAADPLSSIAGQAPGVAAGAAPTAGAGWGGGAGVQTAASTVSNIAQGAAPGGGNMLAKMAKGAGKFATSQGGGQIIGNVLKGYAEGKALESMEKKERKEVRRFNKLWADSDIASRPIFDIKTPTQGGQTSAARNISEFTPRVSYGGKS